MNLSLSQLLDQYNMDNPDIPFPPQAKQRSDEWQYMGWIANPPDSSTSKTFDEFVEDAKKSDHGEIREVDIYEWGAVCWVKE